MGSELTDLSIYFLDFRHLPSAIDVEDLLFFIFPTSENQSQPIDKVQRGSNIVCKAQELIMAHMYKRVCYLDISFGNLLAYYKVLIFSYLEIS